MNYPSHVVGCFQIEELRTKSKESKAQPFCFWGLRMVECGKQSEAASQFPFLVFTLPSGKVQEAQGRNNLNSLFD